MPKTKIKQYFLAIRLIKFTILISLILIFIAIIFPFLIKIYSPANNGSNKPRAISIPKITQSIAEGTRLYGTDKKEQPYSIEAKEIVQQSDKRVEMEQVYASQVLEDSKVITVKSDKAIVDQHTNQVKMIGNIIIFWNDLYSLSAQEADIDYDNAIANGNTQVELQAKFGKIEADQFEIKNEYKDIRFFGNRVKTTLYSKDKYDTK